MKSRGQFSTNVPVPVIKGDGGLAYIGVAYIAWSPAYGIWLKFVYQWNYGEHDSNSATAIESMDRAFMRHMR